MRTDRFEPSLAPYRVLAEQVETMRRVGHVTELIGLVVAVRGLQADQGELCLVEVDSDLEPVLAEVVGFRRSETLIMPLGELHGIGPGTKVRATGHPFRVRVGDHLLGQVLDGLGRPLEGGLQVVAPGSVWRDTVAPPPNPMERERITRRIQLGVRVLDSVIPCGDGQRLGIFAGSGVGKSSTLGMIARSSEAEVNVICLVGERGREVKDFIERDLGPEGLSRSIVVCATSDQPALVRIKAALVATSIAEHFRDRGRRVVLMMDSVTRLAMAQREVGLAVGEPPATRGYPPSVWALLPQVLERAGATSRGSITALYTVLVEGDDMNEPIADTVRSILDGHVVLDRRLAHKHHYPAIDTLQSVSRLQTEILTPDVLEATGKLRETLARFRDKEDLVSVGAYQAGADPLLDYAIAKMDDINAFLRQEVHESSQAQASDAQLVALMADKPSGAAGLPVPPPVDEAPLMPIPGQPAIPELDLGGA